MKFKTTFPQKKKKKKNYNPQGKQTMFNYSIRNEKLEENDALPSRLQGKITKPSILQPNYPSNVNR